MILATSLLWTLTMQGIAGPGTFGPYDTLQQCRAAMKHYQEVQDRSHWHGAVCRISSGYAVKVG